MPASLASLGALLATSVWFLIVLFLKLCYSTALFATLAEITRRIDVFRGSRRPTARALLLLPVVVLFCSAILFALNLWPIFGSGLALNGASLLRLALRLGLFVFALGAGAALGLLFGSRVRMGHDRFGGVLCDNPGRYLSLWLAAFGACGFFRLLPWGFLSFASVFCLVLLAASVTAAHWLIYGRYRAVASAPAPLPGETGPVRLALTAREAVGLALLARYPQGLDLEHARLFLAKPDPALVVHPAWQAEAAALQDDDGALTALLASLGSKGLAAQDGGTWVPTGAAARLAGMGHVREAVALTVKEGDQARTFVCQRLGPLTLVVEPGPATLRIDEQAPGTAAADALARAVGAAATPA